MRASLIGAPQRAASRARAADVNVEELLGQLRLKGPVLFRRLSLVESRWRGRYLLMVYAMGASAEFAWANALASDPVGAAETRAFVAAVSDDQIDAALRESGVRVEGLFVD